MALNRHEIMGRLTRDPDLTTNQDETKNRVNFTVAVDDDYGDGTEFIDCVLFGKRAAVIDKYFSKGSGIFVEGKGQNRKYKGKDGVERKAYSIVVRDFKFPPGSSRDGSGSAPKQTETTEEQWTEQEGSIPF